MNGTTLMQASRQWATRPADERFTSLDEMAARMEFLRSHSRQTVVSSRALTVVPEGDDHQSITVRGPSGHAYAPTHWAFGQLAGLAEAPSAYLRTLPSEIAADAMNFGLRFKREVQDVGVLLYKDGHAEMRAATGPTYGRIWNIDVVNAIRSKVGDGVTGTWRVPGIFGKKLDAVTKDNTTLYASDRDMFIFLADEERKITVPNRRDGKPGQLSRGFFCWNSEVGKTTLGIATFLFDYVCGNRIVWGATEFKQLTVRHTSGAPDRWLGEVLPALRAYAHSSEARVLDVVKAAQQTRIDDIEKFLKERFNGRVAEAIAATHVTEEGRPIETLWDAATGVTAYARELEHQDTRLDLEREGGRILDLARA